MGLFSPRPRGSLQPFQLRRGEVTASLHPRVGPELSSGWLADPNGLVDATRPSSVWRGASPDGTWFVKRRTGAKGRRALLRSFARGLELEELGLAVPVHMGVLRSGSTTWLVTEWLAGEDLDVALSGREATERGELIENLAELVAHLHHAGYRQRDLKAPNLRVSQENTVALVDLEGVHSGASSRRREKDLGRLAASFLVLEPQAHGETDGREWHGFVEAYARYLKGLGEPEFGVESLFSRTRERGRAKLAEHERRGLPSR
jgi:tRNA A-37 threonylcarbamoyl transferase component Bud32